MNFIKKMCILRQVKQGFSGDGKTLSGLVKIEQYGKNLSVEVSVINFAPLSSGEYYCLIADSVGRTEMLPLRGKSLFNIVSELDASDGFCAVVCFVKNGVVPIACGVNGNKIYDWRSLVKNSAKKAGKETAATNGSVGYEGDRYEPNFTDGGAESVRASDLSPTEAREEKPRDATGIQAAKNENRDKYDDESLAAENYYDREENHERFKTENARKNAYAESGDPLETAQERENAQTNGDDPDVRHPFTTDSDGYYLAVKGEIDALFAKYPKDESLKGAFADSEWVRVRGEDGKADYLVGVIYDDLKAKYICYALPALDQSSPPEEIRDVCAFVPCSLFKPADGFFVIFQSCATGECIRPENA